MDRKLPKLYEEVFKIVSTASSGGALPRLGHASGARSGCQGSCGRVREGCASSVQDCCDGGGARPRASWFGCAQVSACSRSTSARAGPTPARRLRSAHAPTAIDGFKAGAHI
eukprot:3202572-Pyramimonas_sp.AAC.1